jgi:hypothetical protein
MSFDFNTVEQLDVIPDKTIAVLQLNIKAGGAGDDGFLKRSKTGEAEGLDCAFTVVEGPHAKRKFFSYMVLSGTTDGHATAADISHRNLRSILESARGIKPQDASEGAKTARVAEYRDFDGMRFMARVGVEPERNGYKAKNILSAVITPDQKEWRQIEQPDRTVLDARAAPAAADNVIQKPKWAS